MSSSIGHKKRLITYQAGLQKTVEKRKNEQKKQQNQNLSIKAKL